MMMELMTGEAGVLRTALGVVLARDGIDVRVRVYLWSGGVEDVVLPTMNAEPYPVGAQVIVQFLSDKTASGMVLGTIEGLLSWRRIEAPAFEERMQPYLQETAAKCAELDDTLTVIKDIFTADSGIGIFAGAVAMPDGRVFLIPGNTGSGIPVIPPLIWDPYSGALHEVSVSWEAGSAMDFSGGCLLLDGRVFFMPSWADMVGQAYIYDPELDRLVPAGEPVVIGYNGCTLMQDGRVLLAPCYYDVTSPMIYDPRADTMTLSAAVTPEELRVGMDYQAAQLLPDGRVLLVPNLASKPLIYDPAADNLTAVDMPSLGEGDHAFGGSCLLADGRVLMPLNYGTGSTVIFDPSTDTISVTSPASHPGGYHNGACLLADGRVLLLPGQLSNLWDLRVWDPATDTYTALPKTLEIQSEGQEWYKGGCVLPDGRVVIVPYRGRNLVVWDPGLGAAAGRDIALAAYWNHQP